MKIQATDWMKICISHISDNYIDNMYSQDLIIRKQKTQICKKWAKILADILQRIHRSLSYTHTKFSAS